MFNELEDLGAKINITNINDEAIQELIEAINSLYESNKAVINYYSMLMGSMKKVQNKLLNNKDDEIYIGTVNESKYYACKYYVVRPKKIIVGTHKDGFSIGYTPWRYKEIVNNYCNYVELNTTSETESIEYVQNLLKD